MKLKFVSLVAPLVVLAGCGAVNNAIPPVSNAFGLEGRTIKCTVPTRSRALVTATGNVSASFNDANIPNLSIINSAKVQLGFSATVTVTVPASATLPASFTLTNLKAGVKVTDAGRIVDVTGNAKSSSLTFNRVGSGSGKTDTYQLASGTVITINDIGIGSVNTLLDILTSPGTDSSNSNNVVGGIEVTVDDTVLPTGSTITFSCTNGDAKLGV